MMHNGSTPIRQEIHALWKLAWPMIVGQLATVGMGVADVAMTGHKGVMDLAAVSLGTALWTMVIVTVIGIMMAINPLVAHEMGAGRHANIAHMMRQAMWKALFIGLLACAALNAATLVFDTLDLEPSLQAMATRFVHVISAGMPAFAMFRTLQGYSTSINQTKPIMLISLGGLAFNIAANWLLVYGNWGAPELGAIGCATATSIGLWLMLAAMLIWIRHDPAYRASDPFVRWDWPHWGEILRMMRIGLPIGVTYFAEVSAFASVGLLVARFGVHATSAHQIALNFSSVIFMVPMSLGLALVTRVGLGLGQNDPRQARFASWVGVGISLAFALLSAIGIALLRYPIAALYTSDPAVQAITVDLLLLAALFQLSDGMQVAAASAVRGYKVTRTPMLIHLVAFWGISLPLGCILGYGWLPAWFPGAPAGPMEASGFWIGLVVGLTFAGVALAWFLARLSNQRVG